MYYLFGGDYYYPCGGVRDLLDKSDNLKELQECATDKFRRNKIDWYHITNSNMEIISSHYDEQEN